MGPGRNRTTAAAPTDNNADGTSEVYKERSENNLDYMGEFLKVPTCSAIGWRKYRIPSALRSQAPYRDGSTIVGDDMGIRRAELLWLVATILHMSFYRCFWSDRAGPV